jgi:uncharacterized membrane protein YqjE
MAGDGMQFRNPAGHAGLLNNLVALSNALAGFFESRIGLFTRESKAALAHFLILAGCLVAAGVLLAFGYVFLIASIIVGTAHTLNISWTWTALIAAALHVALAVVCLLIARSRIRKPVFSATAAELKRDRQWLKNLDKTNRSNS